MNICLLIPAYNEARTIGQIVAKARKVMDSVVVVDDGSRDATAQIAHDAGALVIKHKVNSGKGAALRTGFQHVLDHGYDAVITMDSDGQHDVDDIPRFMEAFSSNIHSLPKGRSSFSPLPKGHHQNSPLSKGDKGGCSPLALESRSHDLPVQGFGRRKPLGIILGSRMHDISIMPAVRKCTNKFTSFVGSLLSHQKLEDSQSGFRLISADVLRTVKLETSGFEMESELLVKASKAGFRIISVPIKTIYGEEVSKINPVVDTYKFLRLLFRSFRW